MANTIKNTHTILIVVFLSSISTLIYEVVWGRPLALVFGSTVYAWGTILVSFILGMGIGSIVFARILEQSKNPIKLFAIAELTKGAFGLLMIPILHSLSPLYTSLYEAFHKNFTLFFLVQGLLLFILMIIPTFLMGATFPLAVKLYPGNTDSAKSAGIIYGVSTIGSALGAGLSSFILLPIFGVFGTNFFAGIINLTLGIYLFLKTTFRKKMLFIILVIVLFSFFYRVDPPVLGAYYYRGAPFLESGGTLLFKSQSLYGPVSVFEYPGNIELGEPNKCKTLLIDGISEGGTSLIDLRTNYLLAYIPLILHNHPKTSLNIGLGTGISSGILSRYSVTTSVEINKDVVKASYYFSDSNYNVLENEHHDVVIADARNFLRLNDDKYDIIVSEPSRTWAKTCTSLFTREFYEIVKSRLNDGGIFAQWIPIFELTVKDFKIFYKTFHSIFPHVLIFSNLFEAEKIGEMRVRTPGELFLIGSMEKLNLWKSVKLQDNLFYEDLDRIFLNIQDLEKLYICSNIDMSDFGLEAKINTDNTPILEFASAKNIVLKQDNAYDVFQAIKDCMN